MIRHRPEVEDVTVHIDPEDDEDVTVVASAGNTASNSPMLRLPLANPTVGDGELIFHFGACTPPFDSPVCEPDLVQAIHPGEFHAMPALAYPMYEPAIFGRSAEQTSWRRERGLRCLLPLSSAWLFLADQQELLIMKNDHLLQYLLR